MCHSAPLQVFYEERLSDDDFLASRFYHLAVQQGVPKHKVEKRISEQKAGSNLKGMWSVYAYVLLLFGNFTDDFKTRNLLSARRLAPLAW